jgi:4-amino-4-deoxy-L-arabinose transferase-like glycosyltransferase
VAWRKLVSSRFLLLLFVLVAFGLRIYHLDYQPLRGDESFSIQFSAHELDWLFPNIANVEPNPPFYYLLLHYWMAPLGQSEFVTRFLSLLFGVISVPLIYRLGRAMGRPSVGALAAVLLAINPFQVWHAQDVRNYTVWPALSMASLVFLLLALRQGRLRHWVGYAGLALLSVYTHYYDLFLLFFQNLFFLALVIRHRREKKMPWPQPGPPLRSWLATQAFLAVAFVPWLIYGSSRLTAVTEGSSPPLWAVFTRCLTAFSIGETVPDAFRMLSVPLLAILLIAGLVLAFGAERSLAVFLILYIVVPSVCVFGVAQVRPLFRERYLNAIAPAYYLVMSWALLSARQALPRWKSVPLATGVAFLGLSAGYSLNNYFYNPAFQKSPDWRALTAYLAQQTQPGDMIVLNYPDPTFSYYYHGQTPSVILPRGLLSEQEKAQTVQALDAVAEKYQRIWFYPLTDPGWDNEGYVETWLNRHAVLIEQRDVMGFRWLIYFPFRVSVSDIQCRLDVEVGDNILLRGYDAERCFGADSGPEPVDPGANLPLTLYWEALDTINVPYAIFIHLVDNYGHIWAQRDGPPQAGDFPTDEWMPADVIADPYSLLVPAGAPPGRYSLLVGIYDPATGVRLPVKAADGEHLGDFLILGEFQVQHSDTTPGA